MVAGVYCNRLRIGMKLDADPTVIYPITKGKPLGRRIKRSELMARSPATTPIASRACPTGRSPIPGGTASQQCSIRRRPRRSISSPTGPAAMSSPTPCSSTRRTSANGTRSAAHAARCSARADAPRPGRSRRAGLGQHSPRPSRSVSSSMLKSSSGSQSTASSSASSRRRRSQERRLRSRAWRAARRNGRR